MDRSDNSHQGKEHTATDPTQSRVVKSSISSSKLHPQPVNNAVKKLTPKEKRATTIATYECLNPTDVLLGRGKRASLWQGNVRYKRIIYSFLPAYEAATKNAEKTGITGEIVAAVKRSGGRFLKETRNGDLTEVPDMTARLKVGQAMRHRRRLHENDEDSDDPDGNDFDEGDKMPSDDGDAEQKPGEPWRANLIKRDDGNEGDKISSIVGDAKQKQATATSIPAPSAGLSVLIEAAEAASQQTTALVVPESSSMKTAPRSHGVVVERRVPKVHYVSARNSDSAPSLAYDPSRSAFSSRHAPHIQMMKKKKLPLQRNSSMTESKIAERATVRQQTHTQQKSSTRSSSGTWQASSNRLPIVTTAPTTEKQPQLGSERRIRDAEDQLGERKEDVFGMYTDHLSRSEKGKDTSTVAVSGKQERKEYDSEDSWLPVKRRRGTDPVSPREDAAGFTTCPPSKKPPHARPGEHDRKRKPIGLPMSHRSPNAQEKKRHRDIVSRSGPDTLPLEIRSGDAVFSNPGVETMKRHQVERPGSYRRDVKLTNAGVNGDDCDSSYSTETEAS